MSSETHLDLDIEFSKALAADVDRLPENEVAALRRRERFIAQHPESEYKIRLVNQKGESIDE